MQAKQDEAHPLSDKDQEQLQNFNSRLGLFQKKIPGRGRRQAIYFSMGG